MGLAEIIDQHSITARWRRLAEGANGERRWSVRLDGPAGHMTIRYTAGVLATVREDALTAFDAVVDDARGFRFAESFGEWARELGYDLDDREVRRDAERTYGALAAQSDALTGMLGADLADDVINRRGAAGVETWRWVRGEGTGGFLSPPGDASHTWSLVERSTGQSMSVPDAAADESLPDDIRARARELQAYALTPSELWIGQIYGYFRNMWTTDGAMWTRADDLISGRPDGAPDDHHAAVVYIRQWFADHQARADLIADPGKGYGSWPCKHCGQRVQYEARHDALTVVTVTPTAGRGNRWTYGTTCPSAPDGRHAH